jgi:hypothetical protein
VKSHGLSKACRHGNLSAFGDDGFIHE